MLVSVTFSCKGDVSSPAASCCCCCPTNNALFNKLPTELRCRNFVNKHRLSIQVGSERAENLHAMCTVYFPTYVASILHTTIDGWVQFQISSREKKKKEVRICVWREMRETEERETCPKKNIYIIVLPPLKSLKQLNCLHSISEF